MLVLTRKPGTSIIIGKRFINIKILEINGQQVRLGIEAPANISIHRDEIYEKIEQQEDEEQY